MTDIVAYCDGSNFVGRGSGAGVYIEKSHEEHEGMMPWIRFAIPLESSATNNEAEYIAVVAALEYFKAVGVKENEPSFIVYSDSELVVRQVNGEYKVKEPRLKLLHSQIKVLCSTIDAPIQFIHLRREMNEEADRLARIGSMLSPTHSNG